MIRITTQFIRVLSLRSLQYAQSTHSSQTITSVKFYDNSSLIGTGNLDSGDNEDGVWSITWTAANLNLQNAKVVATTSSSLSAVDTKSVLVEGMTQFITSAPGTFSIDPSHLSNTSTPAIWGIGDIFTMANDGSVIELNTQGQLVRSLPGNGGESSESLAFDSQGDLLVAGAGSIIEYGPDGKLKRTIDIEGSDMTQIVTDALGNIVVNQGISVANVQRIDAAGQLIDGLNPMYVDPIPNTLDLMAAYHISFEVNRWMRMGILYGFKHLKVPQQERMETTLSLNRSTLILGLLQSTLTLV